MSGKRAITAFLSRKSMITRLSIAFEDFLGSSIAPQVMPPCQGPLICLSDNTSYTTCTYKTLCNALYTQKHTSHETY